MFFVRRIRVGVESWRELGRGRVLGRSLNTVGGSAGAAGNGIWAITAPSLRRLRFPVLRHENCAIWVKSIGELGEVVGARQRKRGGKYGLMAEEEVLRMNCQERRNRRSNVCS